MIGVLFASALPFFSICIAHFWRCLRRRRRRSCCCIYDYFTFHRSATGREASACSRCSITLHDLWYFGWDSNANARKWFCFISCEITDLLNQKKTNRHMLVQSACYILIIVLKNHQRLTINTTRNRVEALQLNEDLADQILFQIATERTHSFSSEKKTRWIAL